MSTNRPQTEQDSGCAAVVSKTALNQVISVNSLEEKLEISENQVKSESVEKLENSFEDSRSSVCENEVNLKCTKNTIYQQQKLQQHQKSQFRLQKQLDDEEKLLEQEKELQKQIYCGANVAHGWRRVITQQNLVIYIR